MTFSQSTVTMINVLDERGIVDPAEEHFKQSSIDFDEYDSTVRDQTMSIEYLVEPNPEQFGRVGNLGSRQGFDFDSFRDRG